MRQVHYSGICKKFIKICTQKPTQKTRLGKPTYMWENSIKMYLKEVQFSNNKSVHLAQHRPQKKTFFQMAIKLAGSLNCGDCFNKCVTIICSGRAMYPRVVWFINNMQVCSIHFNSIYFCLSDPEGGCGPQDIEHVNST